MKVKFSKKGRPPFKNRSLLKQKGLTLIELLIAISLASVFAVSQLNHQLRQFEIKGTAPVGMELATHNNGVRAFLALNNAEFDIAAPAAAGFVTTYGGTFVSQVAGVTTWSISNSLWLKDGTCGTPGPNPTGFVPCSHGEVLKDVPYNTTITAVAVGAGVPPTLTATTSLDLRLINYDAALASHVALNAQNGYADISSAQMITSFGSYWANDADTTNALPFENIGFVYAQANTQQSTEPYLRVDGTNMMTGPIRYCIDDGSVNPPDTCAAPVAANQRIIRGINAITFWDGPGGPFNTDPVYAVAQFSGAANSTNIGYVSGSANEGERSINNLNRVTSDEIVDYSNTNFFINPDGITHLDKVEALDQYVYRGTVMKQGSAITFDEDSGVCAAGAVNCDGNRGMDDAQFDGAGETGPQILADGTSLKISTSGAATNRRIQLEHNGAGYVDISAGGGGPGYLAVNDIVLKGLGGGVGVSILDLLPKYVFQGSQIASDGSVINMPACPAGSMPKIIVTPQASQFKSVQTNVVTYDAAGNASDPTVSDGVLNVFASQVTAPTVTGSGTTGGTWRIHAESSVPVGGATPAGTNFAMAQSYCAY